MNNTQGLSVLICSNNGGKLIGETLRHLAQQAFTQPIDWEVVLVDNASTDDLVQAAQQAWSNRVPLRIVSEPRLGVAFARLTGIENCSYEAISFLDDDNWAAPHYVENAYLSLKSKPKAGAVGSQSQAVFETPPPKWFARYENNYAVGQQYPQSGKIETWDGLVWGAGMVLRRSACMPLIEKGFEPILLSRQGAGLKAGEDSELLLLLRMCGWEIYYDGKLKIRHYMPSTRLTWKYYLKMRQGLGATKVYLDLYRKLLAWVRLRDPLQKLNWRGLARGTLAKILKDPAAPFASLGGSAFEGNYRVALYHFYLGELRERLRLGKQLESIQSKLIQDIQRYPLAWKDGQSQMVS